MSRYTALQLWTYGGSAALFILATFVMFLSVFHTNPTVPTTPALACFSIILFVLGRHMFREGREQLASDHWRAEDFRP